MKILYFSATGNSLAVAKNIGGELISIPQAIKNQQYEFSDDMIGFVFPTYCCYPPKMIRDFLSMAKLDSEYKFAIATYGNPIGNGGDGSEMLEFDKIARRYHHAFQYLNAILMVDNYIDHFVIEKELAKIPSKKIEESISQIKSDLQNRRNYVKNPGTAGKIITAFCKPLVHKQDSGLTAKNFSADENCIGCGICTKVCPYGNISIRNGKPQFGDHCLGCYACIHNCPKAAIHKKNERCHTRFRQESVSLNEIIEANNQGAENLQA